MTKKKWSRFLVALLVLTMSVWTLAGCGGSGEEETATDDGTYSASEVTSDMSMAEEVQAYYDAVDMDYALKQTKKLAYSWEEFGEYRLLPQSRSAVRFMLTVQSTYRTSGSSSGSYQKQVISVWS